ncbi:heterocyst differentiation protein HetF [Crinalium epipsammum PCC 9333]|uniref:Heterocyst differentiation protein HetF n=1 Tax=Crinalium epipsammum PCC 9333 TaxID=1173022 RepID=K9VZX9_9CYAN|nr:CHAT domain-containing protein [Crinalium epipsammum]AFZ13688.1 heterocyst differentiation protein HetF [Crinalium epipsammum PCC 9333]
MTQEFYISVTPLETQDQYLVRIERVASGVPLAEVEVNWAVEEWLTNARKLMNDPLFGLLESKDTRETQSSLNLVALGQELYNALFKGSLRESWLIAQAIAENQHSVLRLHLGLKGSRLSRLPWEVLHAGDRPLATRADVAFSRYQLSTSLKRNPQSAAYEENQPIKILMVIAAPTDKETLKLKQEANHLQAELRDSSPQDSPIIQLTILEQPGREQLSIALEQGRYQIFHYAGHSNLGVAGGDLYLVSAKSGLSEVLNGDDLAGLLVNNGVQLAVFNSCRSADTATSDPADNGTEQNLVQALIKRGIPSVLAMAERIPDEVALTLTRLFYRNLKQGYPIDLSLSRARQGLISAYGSNQLYWALPVLYLHRDFNGFLTNYNDPTQISSRLSLADSFEDFLASEDEKALFTPSNNFFHSHFLDTDDDLMSSLDELSADYEDDSIPDMFEDMDSGNSDYEEDLALVSDLFQQLCQANPTTDEPVVTVSDSENLLPQGSGVPPISTVYQGLPENPQYRRSAPAEQNQGKVLTQQETANQPLNHPSLEKPLENVNSNSLNSKLNSWRKGKRFPVLLPVLTAAGICAIAISGFLFLQNRPPKPGDLLPEQLALIPSQQNNTNIKQIDFQKTNTPNLATLAIEKFSQGDLVIAQQAVTELLNRNALPQASAALSQVPKQQLNNPEISFLRGRLAWQSAEKGSKDFSFDDARRYWEIAKRNKPKSPQYLNALGFAYYNEGKYDLASKVWFDALYLSKPQPATATNSKIEKNNHEVLNTYAGLALVLRKLASSQPAEKRQNFLSESMKLRQQVMNTDPVHYQPEALSKDWIWSKKAIQDWKSLLKIKS